MGCRCCKMIQSYIFDPQEVQTSGYVNEINNYRSDEQDGSKFKGKHNSDIQVHKNELQNADLLPPGNRHKLNNTKDAVWNHRGTALCEEGTGKCVEKGTFNINGIHSYSGAHLSSNTNHSNEVSRHICSGQRPSSPTKSLYQPKGCYDNKILENEDHPKVSSEATEHVQHEESPSTGEHISGAQSPRPEAQDKGIHSPGPDDHQNASQAGTHRAVGFKPLANNHTQTDQITECNTVNKCGSLSLCKSKSCDLGDTACRVGTFNEHLKDKNPDDLSSPRPQTERAQAVKYAWNDEIKGELEEEDAELAEALAALEAATAGEDFDEEEEEY